MLISEQEYLKIIIMAGTSGTSRKKPSRTSSASSGGGGGSGVPSRSSSSSSIGGVILELDLPTALRPPPQPGPPLAQLALQLTSQEWNQLSLNSADPITAATDKLDLLVERITALFLVRIVACVAAPGTLPDSSTTMVCSTFIAKRKTEWPKPVTAEVQIQIRSFIRRMLSGYKDVPYHNREHAYHVILSVNKLLDMATCCFTQDPKTKTKTKFKPPPSFGLRHNPMAMLACLFAALIHDVEHQGIPNRQLASENDRLAVLYNDQSIAENWSIYIAFSELLQDEFQDLRTVLFGPLQSEGHSEKYREFRKMVVNMVLSTDIACPVRSQVVKSKWKEAFGEMDEDLQITRKVQSPLRRQNSRHHNSLLSSNHSVTSAASDNSGIIVSNMPPGLSHSPKHGGQGFDQTDTEEEDEEDLGLLNRKPGGTKGFDSVDEGDETGGSDEGQHSTGTKTEQDQDGNDNSSSKTQTSSPLTPQQEAVLPELDAKVGLLERSSSHHIKAPPGLYGGRDDSENEEANKGKFSLNQYFKREQPLELSTSTHHRYRQQLGILRTVDLGGETLETFSRHTQERSSSSASIAYSVADHTLDEPDELKMSVVLETILTAADIAHNLQSWEHMTEWNRRLYFELRRAYVMGRGHAIQDQNWFQNQISFLESYALPLAARLEETGVWGDADNLPGFVFTKRVELILEEWFQKGKEFSKQLIRQGEKIYPLSPTK